MAAVHRGSDSSVDGLWEHLESPSRRGPLIGATCTGSGVNPLCGDEVEIQLQLSSDRQIQRAAFVGRGCAVSQGAASLICERIEGLAGATVADLSTADVLSWLGVPLSPIRQRCALLAFEALTKALSAGIGSPARLVILDRDDTLIRLPPGARQGGWGVWDA